MPNYIIFPYFILQYCGNLLDIHIAGIMAMGIIDCLKVIDIQQDHCQGVSGLDERIKSSLDWGCMFIAKAGYLIVNLMLVSRIDRSPLLVWAFIER